MLWYLYCGFHLLFRHPVSQSSYKYYNTIIWWKVFWFQFGLASFFLRRIYLLQPFVVLGLSFLGRFQPKWKQQRWQPGSARALLRGGGVVASGMAGSPRQLQHTFRPT